MTNDPVALKPCPFCGKPPVIRNVMEEYGPEDGHPGGEFHAHALIQCDHCGIEVSDEYRSQAVENWNTRAADAALPLPADDEAAWLVERFESGMSEPKYWAAGHPAQMSAWTSNRQQAIRFARRIDAERVTKCIMSDIGVRICEITGEARDE